MGLSRADLEVTGDACRQDYLAWLAVLPAVGGSSQLVVVVVAPAVEVAVGAQSQGMGLSRTNTGELLDADGQGYFVWLVVFHG